MSDIIREALLGNRGEDQQRIAVIGYCWIETVLKKNADYGSSVWQSPELCPDMSPDAAILVRMSDKISRIRAMMQKPAEVAESLEDSIRDLGGYCLLYLARPREADVPPGPTELVVEQQPEPKPEKPTEGTKAADVKSWQTLNIGDRFQLSFDAKRRGIIFSEVSSKTWLVIMDGSHTFRNMPKDRCVPEQLEPWQTLKVGDRCRNVASEEVCEITHDRGEKWEVQHAYGTGVWPKVNCVPVEHDETPVEPWQTLKVGDQCRNVANGRVYEITHDKGLEWEVMGSQGAGFCPKVYCVPLAEEAAE